ncbi:Ig-like and fibronectin type-III domain-containing protein 1 [Thrips palmi]|uniref:Ig-like and fibronectin type-III domain-containing protein 1 n=1 Tax=Thrips palmi TaxID=161013 RepID=A0A6P8ZYM1_THRPL|nr:Ig-like and fibronectin type-III domain-containing protein 1 [Thrips palmi]
MTWSRPQQPWLRSLRVTAAGLLLSLALHALLASAAGGEPRMSRQSLPVESLEGSDALLTCVVTDVANNTVLWKYISRGQDGNPEALRARVLTAGETRITSDPRFSVLHDAGGGVWVLSILNATTKDAGIYTCELNTTPLQRSFHELIVRPASTSAPPAATKAPTASSALTTTPSTPRIRDEPSRAPPVHNYTQCCVDAKVTCLGFCNIQSILEGNTGQDPENCEADFPAIVKCMADGRNHVPCCIDAGVPDICRDVCRGEYTVITDNIKTHFSCSRYTEQTLACIAQGVEILPSRPERVFVESVSMTTLRVNWRAPLHANGALTGYVVNLTSLKTFDDRPLERGPGSTEAPSSQSIVMPHAVQIKVPPTDLSAEVKDLTPFTMYEVSVTAFNKHGSSLPSDAIRSLTLSPRSAPKPSSVAKPPKLPDIKSCCVAKNISRGGCVDKLCDPARHSAVQVPDLMICAPWAASAFSCLANGVDHTNCCKARGLPELCQELCSGNVTQIDFTYFKCVQYMDSYSSCLLQGYGVLPSSPTGVYVSNEDIDFAIVHWDQPKTLGETVKSYFINYRQLDADEPQDYTVDAATHSPFILEGLQSDARYEVFLEAVNAHGPGEPSSRVVFKTKSKLEEAQIEDAAVYNLTACCVSADLSQACLPLCSYDASMNDIQALGAVCGGEFNKLLRCGAGGRNHGPCCGRRGVPPECMPLCSGVVADSLIATATRCIPFIGNIVQCFEEGTGLLPGPVGSLQARDVTDDAVTLSWEPPVESNNASEYIVHYSKVDNATSPTPFFPLTKKNTTDTSIVLSGLDKDAHYNIFVVAKNKHGTSLPSAVILVKITKAAGDSTVKGVTSPPHSVVVSGHSATWVAVSWQPPEVSHPSEKLTYRLHFKAADEPSFVVIETTVTSHVLEQLTPNTKYIMFVSAVSQAGESLPSETLLAWTEPALPPHVEPPTVHPMNLVIEGSSMTVLCIAMGTPTPTISLYLSGRLVRQKTTRHMVTVISNVTRDMNEISCYADNGYGTPMQASKRIVISHGPHITAAGITMAVLGDTVDLECTVEAQPQPKMLFWKDASGWMPVIQGGQYNINVNKARDEESKWTMKLTINKIKETDEGEYYCHAENAFGSSTQPVSVRIRNVAATNNVTQCCMEQNVSSSCMDACSFYLDIDAVIDRPACVGEFDKLMKCAADGSDHRSCCAQWGVPRRCLDWCRGEPLLNGKFCVLSYTKQIVSCFQENRDKLPGPPQNVQVEPIDSHSVRVKWEPPVKNPHTVEVYRVFFRQQAAGSKALKNDTKATSVILTGLKENADYECVVKAGNHLGTSTLTEPIVFNTASDKYITTSSSLGDDSSHVGVAVGVVLALLIVLGVVAGSVWFVRSRHLLGRKHPGGVAFENPSYLREVNMDHIQVPQGQPGENPLASAMNGSAGAGGLSTLSGTGNGMPGASGGVGWKQESLHVPAQQQEVAPSLYEELKLGQDGAGFKKLKP